MPTVGSLIAPQQGAVQSALLQANEHTAGYGLVLTQAQALEIAEAYCTSLMENRIVEVGCGGITKLLEAFAASCYVFPENYAAVIREMTEAFYYVKREVPIEINDNAVIAAMVDFFDNVSHGSMELFIGRDLEILIGYIASGRHNWEENPHYHIKEEDSYDTAPDYTSADADEL